MSRYRKSWTTAMQEVQESAALQLKMAFDDAGIKIKGTKGGKLVISKKDEKKVEKIIAKQMKKPSDAKRVLGSQIVFEETEIDEKTYYNLERGVYEMGKEKHDRKKEVKQGYPNAIEVKSTVKQAAATVAKLNKEEVEIDEVRKTAKDIGFDWNNERETLEKVYEELAELKEAIKSGYKKEILEEFGDLLFSIINLSRHLKIRNTTALRVANNKFERRFKKLQNILIKEGLGKTPSPIAISKLESIWRHVKSKEKKIKRK